MKSLPVAALAIVLHFHTLSSAAPAAIGTVQDVDIYDHQGADNFHQVGVPAFTETAVVVSATRPLIEPRATETKNPCSDKCKRKCRYRNEYRDPNTCKCLPCNPAGNGCVPEKDSQKGTGKCPTGYILDPAEGGQDQNTENPKCIPDDAPKDKVTCAKDIEEKDKPACKASEYRFVRIWENPAAGTKTVEYTCERTRKFYRDKESKFEETRKNKKIEYDQKKGNGDSGGKEDDIKNSKKANVMRCLQLVTLTLDESYFYLATGLFDEEFALDDEILKYIPSDVPDAPSTDIHSEAYLEKFIATINKDGWIVNRIGPGAASVDQTESEQNNSSSSLEPRGPGREAEDALSAALIPLEHEKRAIPAVLVAMGSFFARLGPLIARAGLAVGSRMAKLVQMGGPRLTKGKNPNVPREKMHDEAAALSRNHNWKRCLRGEDPVKG